MLHRSACAAGLIAIALVLPACATVPRRAEVESLASRILGCPPESIRVAVVPIDAVCAERVRDTGEDGRTRIGPCVAWIPLEWPEDQRPSGWIVEGCGHIDRFAPHSCDAGGVQAGRPVPAEYAFDGMTECSTY